MSARTNNDASSARRHIALRIVRINRTRANEIATRVRTNIERSIRNAQKDKSRNKELEMRRRRDRYITSSKRQRRNERFHSQQCSTIR